MARIDPGLCESFTLDGHTYVIPINVVVEIEQLRKALGDMLAHMFGPDNTGKTRPEIEAQARAALHQ